MKFNFVKNRKIFFAISILMVVATIVSLLTVGLNWDIEFVGGTELTFDLDNKVTKDDEKAIEEAVKEIIGNDSFSSIRVAEGTQVIVRTTLVDKETNYDELNSSIGAKITELYPEAALVIAVEGKVVYSIPAEKETEEKTQEANDDAAEETESEIAPETAIREAVLDGTLAIQNATVEIDENGAYVLEYTPASEVNLLRGEIEDKVNELYPFAEGSSETTRLTGMSTVSAEVSDSLKKTAVTATALAIVLMLVYIAFRFEGRAAFAAVICLAHDVIAMILAYSVFQIPVSSTIIAAILTIVGYSINATIVIFDRIRENIKQMPSSVSFEEKTDSGIKSTLWRSLNTTITTLITIGLIYIMGVTSIKNFALPLIVGIIAGVYSSVCLSGNLWVVFKKIGKKN